MSMKLYCLESYYQQEQCDCGCRYCLGGQKCQWSIRQRILCLETELRFSGMLLTSHFNKTFRDLFYDLGHCRSFAIFRY